jgi:hypothetical protein
MLTWGLVVRRQGLESRTHWLRRFAAYFRLVAGPRRNAVVTRCGDHVVMEIRRVVVGCVFEYSAEIPTPTVFQVQPLGSAPVTVVREQFSIEPAADSHRYTDLYGNPCLRLVLPAGGSSFRYEALVDVPDATEDADEDAPELPPGSLPDEVRTGTCGAVLHGG